MVDYRTKGTKTPALQAKIISKISKKLIIFSILEMLRKRVPQQGGVHRENTRDCPRGAGTGEHDAILNSFFS
jgi:hypothetical protein